MIRLLRRWRARWRLLRDSGDELKRRVSVENYLWQAHAGKKPLPDREKCRELAQKLGIPGRVL